MPDKPKLLAGGNPQIPKGDGDAPVQAWIAAAPGWKGEVAARIDALYGVGDQFEEADLTARQDISEAVETARAARAAQRAAEAKAVAAEARIKAALGTAEIGHLMGGRRVTWKTHRKSSPSGIPTVYRVLRLPRD